MPPKDTRTEAQKRLHYYFDEAIVFLVMLLVVLFRETITQALKGDPITNMVIKMPRIVAGVVLTILVYGKFHDSFKYNERKKPPLYKRLTLAIGFGLGVQDGASLIM